jgi:hypothetical protein
MTPVRTLLGAIAFLALGVAWLAYPRRIQRWGIEFYARHQNLAKFSPFAAFSASPYFLIFYYVAGILVLIVGAALLVGFFAMVIHTYQP